MHMRLTAWFVGFLLVTLPEYSLAQYRYVSLAESVSGTFSQVHIAGGKVAYNRQGTIYRWERGHTRRVVGIGDASPYGVFTQLFVNGVSRDETLYWGRWTSGIRGAGLFLDTDGVSTTVAAPGVVLAAGSVDGSVDTGSIDLDGNVAVAARFGQQPDYYYALVFADSEVARTATGRFSELQTRGGRLVFSSHENNPAVRVVYHWDGFQLSRVVQPGDPAPGGNTFYSETMGRDVNDGQVLFGATWRLPSLQFVDGIFLWNGIGYSPVVVEGEIGPFGLWSVIGSSVEMAITPTGLYFLADTPKGRGIYRVTTTGTTCVFAIGQRMFGSTLASFGYGSSAGQRYWTVDDDGTVAFSYQLGDGRRGVALALPPTPISAH